MTEQRLREALTESADCTESLVENPDGSMHCPKCGWVVPSSTKTPNKPRAALAAPIAAPADEARDKLVAFAAWCIRALRGDNIGSDIDGGDAQDEMERLGMMHNVTVTEPCGEHCNCAEYGDFPQECLRFTPEVRAAMATPAGTE